MNKTLFEKMGGTYEKQGDYLIPCLILPTEKEETIGLYGKRLLRYLEDNNKLGYMNLLTSGELNSYLADVGQQANETLNLLMKHMKQAQEITEQLKAEQPVEWVQKMNNIRECAMEIVNLEITTT